VKRLKRWGEIFDGKEDKEKCFEEKKKRLKNFPSSKKCKVRIACHRVSDAVQEHKVEFPVGRSTSTPPKFTPNADVNMHRLMAGASAFGQLSLRRAL
jgi:hypothetical protein